ncbi:MAG: hypothetical protein LBH38_03630 [Holosporales bacterium]|nr:hypothetical protein [Holosporales bacterium]
MCFVKIAIADPGDIYTRDRIIHALGPHFHVEFVVALKQQILNFYASYKRKASPGSRTEVNRQTYDLLQEAIACRASDVHFEPEDSLVPLSSSKLPSSDLSLPHSSTSQSNRSCAKIQTLSLDAEFICLIASFDGKAPNGK